MPPPLLIAPFGLHAALAASKHAAVTAAGSVDLYAVSSTTLAVVLARQAWKNLPEWIKEDVAIKNLLKQEPSNPLQELSTLASVIEKLQALVDSASTKLAAEPILHLHAAMLAYIQLSSQLQKTHPMVRNDWYCRSGRLLQKGDNEIFLQRSVVSLKQCLDFATWAYETDTETLQRLLGSEFEILQHNTLLREMPRPGHVGHFVAVSRVHNLVVVGIRGTSTLEDVLTDCCGRAVSLTEQEDGDDSRVEVRAAEPHSIHAEENVVEIVSGHEKISCEDHDDYGIRCHEGILISAKRLVDLIQPTIEKYVLGLGFSVLLTGHSLGAGVASIAAVVLRSRLPDMAQTDRMNVTVFAPPPVLDHDTSVAASSYTISVVNNSDLIARSSLMNLAVLLEFLRVMSDRLVERRLAPTNPKSTAALFRKLMSSDDNDLIMTVDEVRTALDAAHESVHLRDPEHLYIPGRVFLLFEKWKFNDDIENDSDERKTQNVQCLVTDGTSDVLRFFELDALRMITDHVTASYYSSIESVLAGLGTTQS